jgi:hypothetical protein
LLTAPFLSSPYLQPLHSCTSYFLPWRWRKQVLAECSQLSTRLCTTVSSLEDRNLHRRMYFKLNVLVKSSGCGSSN